MHDVTSWSSTRSFLRLGVCALLVAAVGCTGGSDAKAPPGGEGEGEGEGPAEGEGEGEGGAEGEGEGPSEGEGEGPAEGEGEGEGEGPAEGEGEGEGPQPECQDADDCLDEDPCTTESCVDEACVREPIAGCCDADDDCAGGVCNVAAAACAEPAVAGDLVITELMALPGARGADEGQWLEILNPGDAPVELYAWTLESADGVYDFGRDAPPTIEAQAIFLIGNSDQAAGGVPVDHVIDGVVAGVDGGRIAIVDALGNVIDEVEIDGDWPVEQGASLSLSGDRTNADANDLPDAWCPGLAPWEDGGDLGSPGEPNPDCPGPPPTVDWCRLQFPDQIDGYAGVELTLYGRVFADGVTDRTDRVDVHADLLGQGGFAPDGSDPAQAAGAWTWINAEANPGWDAGDSGEPGNDEYQAAFPVPAPGDYDLAFRFSLDAGVTWVYCDTNAGDGSDGSEDGYSPDDSGALTSAANPCDDEACDTPPDAACVDIYTLATHVTPGVCDPTGGQADCSYEELEVSCRETDQVCLEGACVDAEPRPAPGEVIFTEIVYDVDAPLEDAAAEWFELHNLTDHPVRLDDCTIGDETGPRNIARLVIEADGNVLFGRSDDPAINGGVAVDYVFDFGLNDGGDTLRLRCDGADIDVVAYDDGPAFPNALGASIRLDPAAYDAAANDNGVNWCLGELVYWGVPGAGAHRGTPGAVNPPCLDRDVDWCRLQHPMVHTGMRGSDLTAYGRIWDEGLTDRSDGVDEFAALVAQAGYGPRDTEPGDGWEWFDGGPNPDWSGAAAEEPTNDEYQATFPVPVAGDWDLAFRFSLDAGETWTVCDGDAGDGADGSQDGYQVANAGKLTAEPAPCDDVVCAEEPDPTCADEATRIVFLAPGACEVQGEVGVCVFDEVATDCSLDGGRCEMGVCVGAHALPAEGDVVFTEILYDPHDDLAEQRAEWFELVNVAPEPRTLHGCVIGDDSPPENEIELVGLNLEPGGILLFAGSDNPEVNGGLVPDATFGFSLTNGGDELRLRCGETQIDRVAYDDGPLFPDARKASIQLHPELFDAELNDDGASWCLAEVPYHGEIEAADGVHLGTPGLPNPPCVFPDYDVDWCRLQFPFDVLANPDDDLTAFGRVWDEGLTDLSPATDPDPALMGELGYGFAGTDPTMDDWLWFPAEPNADYVGEDLEANNDEYVATFPVPQPGLYDFAYRFTLDEGETWLYCDRDAGEGSDGSQDGYQAANAGHLTSEGDPCADVTCEVAPAVECDDDGLTRVTWIAPGQCQVMDGNGVCAFEHERHDCSDDGRRCVDGECVFPPPAEGDVIFTEVLYDPHNGLEENTAEWFELRNVGETSVALEGCVVGDTDAEQPVAGITLDPGGLALFARSDDEAVNGGLVPDHLFEFSLNNAGNHLFVRCGDVLVDEVSYDDGEAFPDARQASIKLDPEAYDAVANDDGHRWCISVTPYFGDPGAPDEHLGTPGADNPPCPDRTVDWCRLQHPETHEGAPDTELTVYGRVYEAGVTDLVDEEPARDLLGAVGYGPRGTDPAVDDGWEWFGAAPNGEFVDPDNDEFMGTFMLPGPGLYDYAYRFTVDGGASWLYCDPNVGEGADGSEDGYQVENAAQLTVEGDPCKDVVCNEPPAADCADDGVTRRTYAAQGNCELLDAQPTCVYGAETFDCSDNLEICVAGECIIDADPPAVGQVIFTEIMYDTDDPLVEANAEWFELVNVGETTVTLDGCDVTDRGAGDPIVGLVLEPNGIALFARSDDPALNGGLLPDHLFDITLNNGGDTLTLDCGGPDPIDVVDYDDIGDWLDAKKTSLSLNPMLHDAESNDLGSSWCLGLDPYHVEEGTGVAHLGSPGMPNPACPVIDFTIDWCRLQHPESAEQEEGTELVVFGRYYDADLTDQTPEIDFDAALVAEAGYGPDGSDPNENAAWDWIPAAPNMDWLGEGEEADNDEWMATLVLPDAGTYDYAYRFSLDYGGTWLYCDLDRGVDHDGSQDGYAADDAGNLVTTAGPCDGVVCDAAPDPECRPESDTLRTHLAPGECVVVDDGGQGECQYEWTDTDCTLDGGRCEAGACVDPAPLAGPGDIAITEVMYDPHADLAEQVAEWFEVANLTEGRLTLHGCFISDNGDSEEEVVGVVLDPGGFVLFAGSADPAVNGGLEPDDTFDFSLTNGGDLISIRCGEDVLDVVLYDDGGDYPDARQASISLEPDLMDPDLNDEGSFWCLGQDTYYGDPGSASAHLGTPRTPNPPCPDTTIDWCRLQWPEDHEAMIGESVTWFGRVYDDGLTTKTDGVDLVDGLIAAVGYGPLASDPDGNVDWTWVEAMPNPEWSGDREEEPDNDEWQATFLPPEGLFDVAYRFSLDDGDTWLYCDRNAGEGSDGSQDGYQTANAGTLAVEGGPCAEEDCSVAPEPECAEDDVTRIVSLAPGVCTVDDGLARCSFDVEETDCSEDGGRCSEGACVAAARPPAVGEIVINEVVYDPHGALNEQVAEWVELTNPTDAVITLDGCLIGDPSGTSDIVGVEVQPGGFALFAGSADPLVNGGLVPDGTFGFSLNNGGDTVYVQCGDDVIDSITYDDGATFPDARQASIALSPEAQDADANDLGTSWCLGQGIYWDDPDYDGDTAHLGTPGAANPACPDTLVDWCRYQWPDEDEVWVANEFSAFARVYEAGLTNQTDRVDVDELLVAEIGYAPVGTEPELVELWVWHEAVPNPQWTGEGEELDNDEYMATLSIPAAGEVDMAARFSYDGGRSWTYCDRDVGEGSDGSEDGYQVANAGSLLVDGGPCGDAPCANAPAAECGDDGVTLTTYVPPGTCAVDGEAAVCTYDSTTTDCSLDGGTCQEGECVDGLPWPERGQVIFTEIMYDTQPPLTESNAEWFELTNVSETSVTLNGCVVGDPTTQTEIEGILLDPGYVALFVRSDVEADNGGLVPDHTFGASLSNGGDTLGLGCGESVIDAVVYDDGPDFPDARAASISLDPAAYDTESNANGENWCLGQDLYFGEGDTAHFGTPGIENPECPVFEVDWCRLQFPLDEEIQVAADMVVYGRMFEDGLTNLTEGVDAAELLLAQAGYGPQASDPDGNAAWTWVAGAGNAGFVDASNDEYLATLNIPVAGTYDFAFRFSLDLGDSWVYCDRRVDDASDGSNDGYQVANAGHVSVDGGPCAEDPCAVAPDPVCDDGGAILTTSAAPGTCRAVEGLAECTYETVETDCTGNGGSCVDGACEGGVSQPAAGEVIITEIMYDTQEDLLESDAEWFEVFNRSESAVSLHGCFVGDSGSLTAVEGVNLQPGTYAVFAASLDEQANGGVGADHIFEFSLTNGGDTVQVICDAGVIDAVAYDDGPDFPDARQASLNLTPEAFDPDANDLGDNWCLPEHVYHGSAEGGNAHTGTPGAANEACPDTAIDWCRLQWPLDTERVSGDVMTVYGRVYDLGLTNLTDGVDAHEDLVAQAGVGPRDSDPDGNADWAWTLGAANPEWSGNAEDEPHNDEYQASVSVPGIGDYDFAYRFSLDAGSTWLYCDRDAGDGADGSQDAYQTDNAGKLSVNPAIDM